jgi:hypothetical protein
VASDRVTAAAAELYGADPGDFTVRRKALADDARAAGDRDAANEITALRKPTRAAWVVNRLARTDPAAPERLAALAAGLRDAAEAKDGRKLRELSARRGELIDGLTGQALDAAGVPDPPAALREEVAATLTSALADPGTAGQFAAGTLTRAAEWSGFGAFAPPSAGVPDETSKAARPQATPAWPTAPRRKDKAPSRAREDDDNAARRQKAIEDAERIVQSAAEAATAAVTEEDRLETAVRDLEERLTKTRAELAGARMRARRAEAAERKARQALNRLQPPEREPKGAAVSGPRSEAGYAERRGKTPRRERPEASAG